MPHPFRAAATAALPFVLLMVLVAAASAAGTATIGVSADPMEDRPFTVTVNGHTDRAAVPWLTVQPADVGCGALGLELLAPSDPVSGDFSLTGSKIVDDPGDYEACLELLGDGDAVLVARVPIAVRAARSSIAIEAPRIVAPGEPFTYSVTADTEVLREVVVDGSPDSSCTGPTILPDFRDVLSGPFRGSGRRSFTFAGPHTLCAYVLDGFTAETTASTRILVSFACRDARRRARDSARRLAHAPRRLRDRRRAQLRAARRHVHASCSG